MLWERVNFVNLIYAEFRFGKPNGFGSFGIYAFWSSTDSSEIRGLFLMKWSAKETFQNLSYVLYFFLNWKNSSNFLFFILCYVFSFSLMNAPFFLKSECTYHISIVTKVSIKSNKRKKETKKPKFVSKLMWFV